MVSQRDRTQIVIGTFGIDVAQPHSIETAIVELIEEVGRHQPTEGEYFQAGLAQMGVDLANVFRNKFYKIRRAVCSRCTTLPPYLLSYCSQCLLDELIDRCSKWRDARSSIEQEVRLAEEAGLRHQVAAAWQELQRVKDQHATLHFDVAAEAARRRFEKTWARPVTVTRGTRPRMFMPVEVFSSKLSPDILKLVIELRKVLERSFSEYSTIIVGYSGRQVAVEVKHELKDLGLLQAQIYVSSANER